MLREPMASIRQTALAAKRGSLLDRRGTEMATDVEARSFYAVPEHVQDPEAVANFFARLNGVKSEKIVGQLSGERSFIYLARQVDAAAVHARADSFVGVYSHGATRRFIRWDPLPDSFLAIQISTMKGVRC